MDLTIAVAVVAPESLAIGGNVVVFDATERMIEPVRCTRHYSGGCISGSGVFIVLSCVVGSDLRAGGISVCELEMDTITVVVTSRIFVGVGRCCGCKPFRAIR